MCYAAVSPDKPPPIITILVIESLFQESMKIRNIMYILLDFKTQIRFKRIIMSDFIHNLKKNSMFEPNSIRSLLSKRKQSRINSAKNSNKQQYRQNQELPQKLSTDPDLDLIIQAKVMIKQIDNKIQNIREWRTQQKLLIQQKMKCNQEVTKAQNQLHLEYLERQSNRQQEELQKMLKKLNVSPDAIKIIQNQEYYDSQKIFDVLKQTNQTRQAIKNQQIASEDKQHLKMMSEIDAMSQIFKNQGVAYNESGGAQAQNDKQKVEAGDFKKQIDEIERQLKQIEDLLADSDQQNKYDAAIPKNK